MVADHFRESYARLTNLTWWSAQVSDKRSAQLGLYTVTTTLEQVSTRNISWSEHNLSLCGHLADCFQTTPLLILFVQSSTHMATIASYIQLHWQPLLQQKNFVTQSPQRCVRSNCSVCVLVTAWTKEGDVLVGDQWIAQEMEYNIHRFLSSLQWFCLSIGRLLVTNCLIYKILHHCFSAVTAYPIKYPPQPPIVVL